MPRKTHAIGFWPVGIASVTSKAISATDFCNPFSLMTAWILKSLRFNSSIESGSAQCSRSLRVVCMRYVRLYSILSYLRPMSRRGGTRMQESLRHRGTRPARWWYRFFPHTGIMGANQAITFRSIGIAPSAGLAVHLTKAVNPTVNTRIPEPNDFLRSIL